MATYNLGVQAYERYNVVSKKWTYTNNLKKSIEYFVTKDMYVYIGSHFKDKRPFFINEVGKKTTITFMTGFSPEYTGILITKTDHYIDKSKFNLKYITERSYSDGRPAEYWEDDIFYGFEAGTFLDFYITIESEWCEKIPKEVPIYEPDFDWVAWAKKMDNKLGGYRKGDELNFYNKTTGLNTRLGTGVVLGGTLGFTYNNTKYVLQDIISGKLTPAMLGKTYVEGIAKCNGLFLKVGTSAIGIFVGTVLQSLLGWFVLGGLLYISASFLKRVSYDNYTGALPYWATAGTAYVEEGDYGVGVNNAGGNSNWPDWVTGGFIPSTPGGTVSPTDETVAGYGTGGESYDSADSALAKQQKYYQAMSDFYAGQSTAGQNYADYYSKAKEVVGFDSKLKAYESQKLDDGTTAEMDDLNKRVASKRAEYLETDTGIYVGGQRVNATITDQGIFMGSGRIGATVTANGIYASGDIVDSNGNVISTPTTGGGTTTINNEIDTSGIGSAIGTALSGAQFTLNLSDVSASSIQNIADNIGARNELEAERVARESDLISPMTTYYENKVNVKDKENDLLDKNIAVQGSEISVRTANYGTESNPVSYTGTKVKAFSNLHSDESFKTAEGVDIKAGYYANPVLTHQQTYNATMLSHGELEANKKFVEEFLPTFQANVNPPEDQVKKLYRFADVSTANRVDIEGLISEIMINKGVQP